MVKLSRKGIRSFCNVKPPPSQACKYIEICENQNSVSLLQHQIKSVQIDCCFRFSKTKWGQLDGTKAGVIYIDITIHQPEDCRLASVLATMTLKPFNLAVPGAGISPVPGPATETATAPTTGNETKTAIQDTKLDPLSSQLEVTTFFGPKLIYGEAKDVTYSTKFAFQPQITVPGATIAGIGGERSKESTETTRWKFEGGRYGVVDPEASANTKQTGAAAVAESSTQAAKYRKVIWKLEENKEEKQVVRNPTLHTAFTFEHDNKSFLLDLEIKGKLRHWHRRVVFPPRSHTASARAKIDAGKLCDGKDEDLKAVAQGLNDTMIEKNLMIGREISGPTKTGLLAGQNEPNLGSKQKEKETILSQTQESITKNLLPSGAEKTKNMDPMLDEDILSLARQLLDLEEKELDMLATGKLTSEPDNDNDSNTPTNPPSYESVTHHASTRNSSGVILWRHISLYLAALIAWLTQLHRMLEALEDQKSEVQSLKN